MSCCLITCSPPPLYGMESTSCWIVMGVQLSKTSKDLTEPPSAFKTFFKQTGSIASYSIIHTQTQLFASKNWKHYSPDQMI